MAACAARWPAAGTRPASTARAGTAAMTRTGRCPAASTSAACAPAGRRPARSWWWSSREGILPTAHARILQWRIRGAVAILALIGVAAGPQFGCASHPEAGDRPLALPAKARASQTRIDASLSSDPDVEALIAPYRSEFATRMSEVLASSPRPMRTDRPEGVLGALVADIMLERARREADVTVHAAVTNNGGLRTSWEAGPITLGLVYELMPFDNEIVLLRFTGRQILGLAGDLAAAGGEPVSGITFGLFDGVAREVEIAGAAPDPAADYWVATNDYLAGGGGHLEMLWAPQELRRTGVLLRDAIADALRARDEVPMPRMGRIRLAR
ncbi:MAG: hypothetical protein GF330_00905 [Candidatus Eisenbacteria bacterium]|nr:hypothetical protein [Candidatus Eisenbacteria bacterium]